MNYQPLIKHLEEEHGLILLASEVREIVDKVNAAHGSFFIRNLTDDSIHEVWKYIKDDQGTISIWSNTWYGRHVIGQDCEFVSQEDQINLHSYLHLNKH
jgi:hypothetical protein